MKSRMYVFLLIAFAFVSPVLMRAQVLPLPESGEMPYSQLSGDPKIVSDPEKETIQLEYGSNGYTKEFNFKRLYDNIYVEYGGFFDDYDLDGEEHFRDHGRFLKVLSNDVLIYFSINLGDTPELGDAICLARTKEAKIASKELIKEAKESIDIENHLKLAIAENAKIVQAQKDRFAAEEAAKERAKAEKEAQAKAEAEAKAKAIAERDAALATYDFCTPLNKYAALIPSRFKSLKGKVLPRDEMYDSADTTFEATEKLQYFDIAKIQTRHKSYNNATDLDFYMTLSSKEEVASKFDIVKKRFMTCFTEKGGWFMNSIGESCSWVKGKYTITLRQFNDTWSSNGGNFLHVQVSPK